MHVFLTFAHILFFLLLGMIGIEWQVRRRFLLFLEDTTFAESENFDEFTLFRLKLLSHLPF